jgi:hypothetical protein
MWLMFSSSRPTSIKDATGEDNLLCLFLLHDVQVRMIAVFSYGVSRVVSFLD